MKLKQKNSLKERKCKCGCGLLTKGIWKTGHHVRLNPRPNNLGSYIKGKKGAEHKNQGEHNKHHIQIRDKLGRFISGGVHV